MKNKSITRVKLAEEYATKTTVEPLKGKKMVVIDEHDRAAFLAGWAAAIKEADDAIGSLRKFYNVENEADLAIQEALNQAQLEIGDLAK